MANSKDYVNHIRGWWTGTKFILFNTCQGNFCLKPALAQHMLGCKRSLKKQFVKTTGMYPYHTSYHHNHKFPFYEGIDFPPATASLQHCLFHPSLRLGTQAKVNQLQLKMEMVIKWNPDLVQIPGGRHR